MNFRHDMETKESESMVQEALMGAKQRSDSKTILRRRQVERCLQQSHSPTPEDKIQAARSIHLYFTDFSDLEEQVIDAIYDLCEDQSLSVRLEGYRAISRISKADSKFIRRNTDVLFQLLQSDDPAEVEVVKQALFDHIAMAPRVTFGVLCDQLLPTAPDADEEETAMRKQVRTLVVDFLEQQVIPRCIEPRSASEDALFECLCELVPQLDVDSIQRVVRNVIVKLPSYRTLASPKGDRIMKLLLDRAETEHRMASKPSLSSSHPFTDTAQSLVVNHCAPSLPLFKYYSRSLLDKAHLESLPNPQKIRAIRSIAGLLDFCNRSTTVDPEVRQEQWKIVDATPLLIEVLLSAGYVGSSLTTFNGLLRNCHQRKTRENWIAPPALEQAISQLQNALDKLQPSTERREVRRMITLVLSSPQLGLSATANSQPTASNPHPSAPSQPIAQPSRTPASIDRSVLSVPAQGPLATKRKQSGDASDNQPRRSLLNRLQSSESRPPAGSKPSAPPAQGLQGLSIKGAASLPASGNLRKAPTPVPGLLSSKELKATGAASFSLLARLADSSLAAPDPRSISEPRHRKKRRC
ncbi:hypothetical protein BKA70DRAFT_1259612 [Coprinopsis sp. MPI-PUGE-AT-0042]|nr:hypothetical protein BKA70DRAFT_1259612 [Coprinopsis sp. MPI-PUGE-AT-0042]